MIKPEMKLVKILKWKHINELMQNINQPTMCQQEDVALVEIKDPQTKKIIELQLCCTSCLRSLTLYGKEKN